MSCICSPTLCTKNTGRRSLLRAVESGTLAFRGSNDELSSWEDAVKSISGRGQSACKAVCKRMVGRGLESVTVSELGWSYPDRGAEPGQEEHCEALCKGGFILSTMGSNGVFLA